MRNVLIDRTSEVGIAPERKLDTLPQTRRAWTVREAMIRIQTMAEKPIQSAIGQVSAGG
jgi:hypothetical protein